MITDPPVRKLRQLDRQGIAKELAALRVGMDAQTARRYRRLGKLPSEVTRLHRNWRTRTDVFAQVWPDLEAKLQVHPKRQAKTLFADLQRRFPGRFADGQLPTRSRKCGLLVQDLLAAKRDLTLPTLLKRLAGYQALIVDDLG
jgi:hypothetical protein